MERQTFFSFHYERDAWRAGQVRNCMLLATEDQHGFIDAVEWETIERQGDAAIERWISEQLEYTSVTVVLIGAETARRRWVRQEILKSWNRGNGIVGVRIHNVKNHNGETDPLGPNPFEQFELPDGTQLSSICKVYDWLADNGRDNLGIWSEEAIEIRGEYGLKDEISLAGNAQRPNVIASLAASVPFKPRSPWCAPYDDRRR